MYLTNWHICDLTDSIFWIDTCDLTDIIFWIDTCDMTQVYPMHLHICSLTYTSQFSST
jgi:hypothetical protein